MKKLLLVLLSVPLFANAQNALTLKVDNDIVVEKYYGEALTVPVVVENEFYGFREKLVAFELVLNEDSSRYFSEKALPEGILKGFKVRNKSLIIDILGISKGTFYIDIPADLSLSERVHLFYNLIVDGRIVQTIDVTVVPCSNLPITYDDFQSNRDIIMDKVWHAEASEGIFVVYGKKTIKV